MKTSFKNLGISSPCHKPHKARKGARVYYENEYMGQIDRIEGGVIHVGNRRWIYRFTDGSLNGLLYIN